MDQQDVFRGLWTITKEKRDACNAEAEAVGKDHPTERGVLQLKAGIYNVAVAAGLALGTDQAPELMSKRFKNLIKHFPDLAARYRSLPTEEKGIMEIALFPEMFMRVNFYDTYRSDLAKAEQSGDLQAVFKARVKKEVLDEILAMWRDFRLQNDLFVFAFSDEAALVTDDYSIHVTNGKVVGDSLFFILANDLLGKECERLCAFTDSLDNHPSQKKERIAEYKCAKYRYAAVSLIHSTLYNNNLCRKRHNLEYAHYLLAPFDRLLTTNTEYQALYEAASANEKPDYSLYYAITAFANKELAALEEKLQNATDWEKIELEERIGGLAFSKDCLSEAWHKRKGVIG